MRSNTSRAPPLLELSEALEGVKPATPITTIACLQDAMVTSRLSSKRSRPASACLGTQRQMGKHEAEEPSDTFKKSGVQAQAEATLKMGASRFNINSQRSRGRPASSRKRDASVESVPALPRPHCDMCGAKECLRPWLDDRCHCNSCLKIHPKECDSPRMRARRASKPSCESFYASKCLKHEFERAASSQKTVKRESPVLEDNTTAIKQQASLGTKQQSSITIKKQSSPSSMKTAALHIPIESRGRLASSHLRSRSRRDPSIESAPELPRPHCDMCGAAECLRPWLDDRCHCDACLGIEKGDCDSPRMLARRAAKPSCESFYASKCLKHTFEVSTPTKSHQPAKQPSNARKQYEEFARTQTLKKQQSELKNLQPLGKQQTFKRVKSEEKTEQPFATKETIKKQQVDIKSEQAVSSLSKKESRGPSSSRGRSTSRKRDPSIESVPDLLRPHCEMCGAAECLRPWLDDRCHCDACLGLDQGECDSPRMKARRASMPCCESFLASKCQKHLFGKQERTISKELSQRQPKKLPSIEKKPTELPTVRQASPALDKQESRIRQQSSVELKKQNSASSVKQSVPSQLIKTDSRGRSSSRGKSGSRCKSNPGTEPAGVLPRPHCVMCGADECLRPELDDRCHCNACLGFVDGECDSPRMKSRRASQPSCESFYASKCLKHEFKRRAETSIGDSSGSASGKRKVPLGEMDSFGSPRHSPSNRLTAGSTLKPMLLPIASKTKTQDVHAVDSQMTKKLKKDGSAASIFHSLQASADGAGNGEVLDDSAGDEALTSRSVCCLQLAWDSCKRRGRRGAVSLSSKELDLASATAAADECGADK